MTSPAPRILFISHYTGRTGAPIGLLAFMRWLRANTDYGIGTILRTPGPLAASFRELGPTVTLGNSVLMRSRLGRRMRRILPRALQQETGKIRRIFAAGSYNLVYSNTLTNGAVLEALAPFRVPVITHVHELAYWIDRAGPENLQQVLRHTTAYIAVAQAVREHLVRQHGLPEDRIRVISEHISEMRPVPTATERASARALLSLPPGAFVVGGCGAEHWRKGRDLIPQLLVTLRRLQPGRDVHFVWVGRSGTAEEEYALRHDLRTAGVEALFHTSGGEVVDPFNYFPAFDVFALLSREDPFPLACLEVAATETPVVCFADAGGMPEFVRDGCGLVAPYLDVNRMAQDILRLAGDPELARACGRRARAKVARENTLATTAPQLRQVIGEVAGLAPPPPASSASRPAPSLLP